MGELKRLQDELADAKDLRLVTISVDPDHDRPEVPLAIDYHGGDWAGDSCVVPVHQRLAVGEAHEARREPRGQREAWAGCRVALAEAGA